MRPRTAVAVILVAVAAATVFWLGRATAPSTESARSAGYSAGLRTGEAQGRQEGRALQEGAALPATSRRPVTDAYNDGYADGANDAFGGGDGGWDLSKPYVIAVEKGSGRIVYRIRSHTPLVANVNYYLCANGRDLCEEPRR
ncbi:hypothetical protein [Cryptosporangium phraense]|uniref:hypothetical protein n=1 Tax=Cryptosporangium phraense TaxID=2593070 RepID=UPI001478471C|nr:hypothetical protein [Cryptosporangium phraense]